jgi:hypothetical protein
MDKYCEENVAKVISRTLMQSLIKEDEGANDFADNILKCKNEDIQEWMQVTHNQSCYQRTFLIHPLTKKCCAELITKIHDGKRQNYLAKAETIKKNGDSITPLAESKPKLIFIKASKVRDVLMYLILHGCVMQTEQQTEAVS